MQPEIEETRGGKRVRLTQDVKGESDRRQTEAFKEAQRAEHGHIHGERHGQTEHQHGQHGHQQHRDTTQPETTKHGINHRNITDAVCLYSADIPVCHRSHQQVTKDRADQQRELSDVNLPLAVTHQRPLETNTTHSQRKYHKTAHIYATMIHYIALQASK